MKYISFALFICLIWAAPIAAHSDEDGETIKQNLVNMWAAVEDGDVGEYLTYVHPDYTVFGEGDIYLQAGKDKERASYTDYLGRVENVRTFMHQPDVRINGDTAWLTYYWTDSGYYTTGEKAGNRFTSKGKSTRIFVKEDGKWLCIHGHFTAVE